MNLQSSGSSLQGTYQTAVGNASGTYPLVGQIDTQPSGSAALGCTVAWINQYGSSHSATAWSGQYQTIDGEDQIIAFWLLTSEQTDPNNDWEATLVGKDVFRREPPSDEEIAANRKRMARSNP